MARLAAVVPRAAVAAAAVARPRTFCRACKRGRNGSAEQLMELPDYCKNSLAAQRAAVRAANRIFDAGDRVLGLFGGVKSKGYWFEGTVIGVHVVDFGVFYDIDYDDGDK